MKNGETIRWGHFGGQPKRAVQASFRRIEGSPHNTSAQPEQSAEVPTILPLAKKPHLKWPLSWLQLQMTSGSNITVETRDWAGHVHFRTFSMQVHGTFR